MIFDLHFALSAAEDGLRWRLARWRLFGLPLPLMPSVECLESGEGDRFAFDITASFPVIGRVIRYRGWLA